MFNIRVYGILLNEKHQVLVSDEYIRGEFYTKFPGGGLEVGEGTRDCLRREFLEELDITVSIGDHIYTTDYYQQSAFNPKDQILAIYYYVSALEKIEINNNHSFNFSNEKYIEYLINKNIECFRWINWSDFSDTSVSLPIDKIVASIVKVNSKCNKIKN